MIDLATLYKMNEGVKNTETNIKAKISFSVESLLSNKCSNDITIEEKNDRLERNQSPIVDVPEDRLHSETEENDDEDITVDDDEDELESRDSLSPNSNHTVIVPQPLHPSIPRMMPQGAPQWPFGWPTHGGLLRSPSPQSK